MGTYIELTISGLSVYWSKNSPGINHGVLYQESDRQRRPSGQIDYDYHADHDLDPAGMEAAFCRPLRKMLPRLELLGFTLGRAQIEYETHVKAWREERLGLIDDGVLLPPPNPMSFEEFKDFVIRHPIAHLDNSYVEGFDEEAKKRARGRFEDDVELRLPIDTIDEISAYSEVSFFGSLIGFLHPYTMLRLLGENEVNLDQDVVWQYGPLVHAGWAREGDFSAGTHRRQTFMIATEGSSDTHILKHALALLRPEVMDFFRFIDVTERHPFSGTGNLLKFAEGLVKIDVQNQIVFLFDNDAEGYDAYVKAQKMTLPPNMRVMLLPDLEVFRSFPTQGPDGMYVTDINRRAAAIECYLDLKLAGYPPAKVVWTNYKRELGVYQGSLEYKDSYTSEFMRQTQESILSGQYDATKLRLVVDALINECCDLASVQ